MKKKFLVEICERRRVKFEVEAENREEAKKVAEDTYQNDDDLMSEMLTDDAVVSTEVDVLHERGPATGIVDEKPPGKSDRHPELYAIISIKNDIVHLEHTVNPDASCCQYGEDALQLESYSAGGWHTDKYDSFLRDDFWGFWTAWNGLVSGGITLNDDFTFNEWYKMISELEEVTPSMIRNLPDGRYVVYADIVKR